MTADFYSLSYEPPKGAWFLRVSPLNPDGSWWDVWAYTRCQIVANPVPVRTEVKHAGWSADFNFASFNIPIVNARVNDIIEALAPGHTQRIPVDLAAPGQWEVMNVLTELDCLDHKRSDIQYYPPDHPKDPGKPRGVLRLVIDPSRVQGNRIFRIRDWTIPVVISGDLLDALQAAEVTGLITTKIAEGNHRG